MSHRFDVYSLVLARYLLTKWTVIIIKKYDDILRYFVHILIVHCLEVQYGDCKRNERAANCGKYP